MQGGPISSCALTVTEREYSQPQEVSRSDDKDDVSETQLARGSRVVGKPEITQFFERVGLAGICSSMRTARAIGEQGEVKGISRGNPFGEWIRWFLLRDLAGNRSEQRG